jgi:DNA-binding NarL/FixJ family response regulator
VTKPIRILLVDDHALVRAGFRSLLQSLPDCEVVAEAENGREALRLIAEHQPDIMLIDIAMPEMNGLQAVARTTKEFPHVRCIILSMHPNEEYVLQSLRVGAVGYLLKDATVAELELAVTSVARGETYLSPSVSKHVVAEYLRRLGTQDAMPGESTSAYEQLTPRKREILQLIAEGNTTQEIANKLGLSVKTVEAHRTQLMNRLDIHDVAGLVRYAIRIGLIAPDG